MRFLPARCCGKPRPMSMSGGQLKRSADRSLSRPLWPPTFFGPGRPPSLRSGSRLAAAPPPPSARLRQDPYHPVNAALDSAPRPWNVVRLLILARPHPPCPHSAPSPPIPPPRARPNPSPWPAQPKLHERILRRHERTHHPPSRNEPTPACPSPSGDPDSPERFLDTARHVRHTNPSPEPDTPHALAVRPRFARAPGSPRHLLHHPPVYAKILTTPSTPPLTPSRHHGTLQGFWS